MLRNMMRLRYNREDHEYLWVKKCRLGVDKVDTHICRYCFKEIKSRDELVTASSWFRIRPYHYRCFQLLEEDTRTVAGAWTPINGTVGLVTVFIMLGLSILMLSTSLLGAVGDLIGVLALYPVLLRILSFIAIESRIPGRKKNK
ncbi:hypothetical protein MUN89_17065 [Halobacillus salinarum]|uniref:Uncharacterized protein n=1 Tax=Halobacillus salinarum TaxID=2932257 RepID=A0ABY4EHQ8_9BACI|nr:hypothetical protein [Halobacillus salinarum]UOQ43603.1 hypothetical protein MUN89_17065 [Halobacillus salinarum]